MKNLRKALEKLNNEFTRPGLLLEITGQLDTSLPWSAAKWPDNGKSGVYIFVDENDVVVYIGKGSATMSARLSTYWGRGSNGETLSKDSKSEGVRHIYTISLPEGRDFEAASIEDFLIKEVTPERNTLGKSR